MEDCVFCNIIKGKIPCSKIYEDEYILAFHDINKKAPVHALIIPKTHVQDMNELTEQHAPYMQNLMLTVKEIAHLLKVDQSGYRLVINTGKDSGQEVSHLHVHLMGGTQL